MFTVNKTLLDNNDISAGEHILCMNGIRIEDAHKVLAKLLLAMTGTNIDE